MNGHLCLMSNRWGLRLGQSQPVLSLTFRLVVRETVPCSLVWPHKASIWTSLSLLSSQRKENLWKIKKDKNKTQASLVPLLVICRFISSPYCVGPDGSNRHSSFNIILLELHDNLQLKQGKPKKIHLIFMPDCSFPKNWHSITNNSMNELKKLFIFF